MAFTLQIKQKKLFKKTILDIPSLAQACGLCYGSNNDFYILQEWEASQACAVFYNPNRIGRGIFFDGRKAEQGCYEVSYNIPTTKAEITDFAKLVAEIERQLGKVEMYCTEEGRNFTSKELEMKIPDFSMFSLKTLNQFCGNKTYQNYLFTLAKWPYTLTKDKVAAWETCTDLLDFEQTLHDLQAIDVYYAKPKLMQKNGTGDIVAFYALTNECKSVFPVRADGFLNLNGLKVAAGFVQFVIYEEGRVLDGMHPYEIFVETLKNRGVPMFDAEHILIPPMSRAELERLAEELKTGEGFL